MLLQTLPGVEGPLDHRGIDRVDGLINRGFRQGVTSYHGSNAPATKLTGHALAGGSAGARLGVGFGSSKRDTGLVLGEPCVEALQGRVEGSGDLEVARTAEVFVEVKLELEHVAEILGAREPKTAVHLGWHVVVAHLLTQPLGERGSRSRSKPSALTTSCATATSRESQTVPPLPRGSSLRPTPISKLTSSISFCLPEALPCPA